MLIVILFQFFISLILFSIMGDICRMKDTFEKIYQIAFRWYSSSDDEEDEDDE